MNRTHPRNLNNIGGALSGLGRDDVGTGCTHARRCADPGVDVGDIRAGVTTVNVYW